MDEETFCHRLSPWRCRPVVAAAAAALLELLEAFPQLRVEVDGERDETPRELLEHATRRRSSPIRTRSGSPRGACSCGSRARSVRTSRPTCCRSSTRATRRCRRSSRHGCDRRSRGRTHVRVSWSPTRSPRPSGPAASTDCSTTTRPGRGAGRGRHADALYGPAAAEAVANRFLGWVATGGAVSTRRRRSPCIVPVYGGLDDVRRCLESVVRHAAGGPAVRAARDRRRVARAPSCASTSTGSARGRAPVPVTVLHNDENLGFVRTVNRGLRPPRGRRRDPQLRHRGHRRAGSTGSPTRPRCPTSRPSRPLTSHGSICTLPDAVIDAFDARERRPAHRRVRERSSPSTRLRLRPEVITGVGFCMYVTRRGARPVRPARRGHVRPRLRRGGRLLPRAPRGRPAAPRRGLDVRVPPRRRVVRRRAETRAGRAARRSSTRAIRSSARPTRRERLDDPLAVSFAGARARARPSATDRARTCCTSLHSPPDATGGTEKYVAALLDDARRRVRLLGALPGRVRLRAPARTGTVDGRPRRARVPAARARRSQVTRMNDEVAARGAARPRSTCSTSTRCTSTT